MKFQHMVGSQLIFEWCGLNNNTTTTNNNTNPLSLSYVTCHYYSCQRALSWFKIPQRRNPHSPPQLSEPDCQTLIRLDHVHDPPFLALSKFSLANCTPVSLYANPIEGERKEFYSLKGLQFMQRSPPILHSVSPAFFLLSIISTAIRVTTKISPV